MVHRAWPQIFSQQFGALVFKNALLSWRRKRATFLYISAPFFFMLLLFGVDRTVQSSLRSSSSAFKQVTRPSVVDVASIAACDTAFLMRSPCFDFVWSGNSSSAIQQIVEGIKRNNPGRPIPDSKVLGFSTPDEVDEFLLANQLRCPGALHFQLSTGNVISYGVQINSTTKVIRGEFEDPIFKFQIPLQAAAEREITRFATGAKSNLGWRVSFSEFPHPERTIFSTIGLFGPTFLLASAMFGFIIQLSSLVLEKELKLRQVMNLMGLMDSVYWSTWLVWDAFLSLVTTMVLVLSGMLFQLNFFLDNNFGVLFLMFFLFQLNLVGFTFLISAFVNKAASANTVGFGIYIVGFLTQLVTAFGFPYSDNFSVTFRAIWSFFPPNLFAQGLSYLGDAVSDGNSGIRWTDIAKCSPGDSECVLTMQGIYNWLIATFFLWIALALYCDNVLKDVYGVRKPWYYFLKLSYWRSKSGHPSSHDTCWKSRASRLSRSLSRDSDVDDDVTAEEALVKDKGIDSSVAVQVRGLVKVFPGSSRKKGCCRWERKLPHYAVKGSWFSIDKGKLFCLLGANGAGKTTTINCLTGIIPVTSGDALVYGESIKSLEGMARIRNFMGVCPQFDILWSDLTGREHLHLFARIKGLESSQIQKSVEDILSKVDLSGAGNARSSTYSGGMKRRLSIAVALIGDPKVLYLDEPTTGMDPIMRRQVWSVIEEAKKECAIILTTHSMEEADVLGDRIAIMAKGKLQCIGTSLHLKSKFGNGYKINVIVRNGDPISEEEEERRKMAVRSFFHERLHLEPCEESKGCVTFAVPQDNENLPELLEELSAREKELGITDTQLGLTTLEEVFLTIARRVELRSTEGRLERVTLGDGTTYMVPVGTRYFQVPGTVSEEHPRGMMIEVTWQQDEDGTLCITDHSELMPLKASFRE